MPNRGDRMSSPGIDEWIAKSPESWAKLAKKGGKNITFEQFKKKFFAGAENENKGYLKEYIKEEQLRTIYEQGLGGTIKEKTGGSPITPTKKPRIIQVMRKGKNYSRMTTPRWGLQSKFVLTLAAKSKSKSADYEKYVDILVAQGRTRQAAIKKIQRTRKELK